MLRIWILNVEGLVGKYIRGRSIGQQTNRVLAGGNLIGINHPMDQRAGDVIDIQIELRLWIDLVESSDIIRKRLIARTRNILLMSQIRKAIHPGWKRVPVIGTWTIEHHNRRNGRSSRRGAYIPERKRIENNRERSTQRGKVVFTRRNAD